MKIVSLNVGRPEKKEWQGKVVMTSIFKKPVIDRRRVSFTNIEGDEQADPRVHGGINKTVYSYDTSHYEHWKNILQRDDWSYGLFGENLTTEGLIDDEVRIGNIYKLGTAKLQAIQPRFPCAKINVRFGLSNMLERFISEERNGIYFKVIEEGDVQVNDEIDLIEESQYKVTIQDFVECYYSKGEDKSILKKILAIRFLPEGKRQAFESFL
jgi:MOSC domain-containing protein YiiM